MRLAVQRGTTALLGTAMLLVMPFLTPAANSDSDTVPRGPLAEEMAELLERQPGGVQVSDNAMAWDGGETLVVWPLPGETRAPAGLGENLIEDVVEDLGLHPQARGADFAPAGVYTSCPSGYYCFYTSSNYNGTRYQFSSTCSSYASNWGFNNQTSSWVNRAGSNKIIYAYASAGGSLLWYEPHPSQSSYVGSSNNNRMSYWTCSHT
jgi:hypothetical protein